MESIRPFLLKKVNLSKPNFLKYLMRCFQWSAAVTKAAG